MERLSSIKGKGDQIYTGFYVYTRNQNNYLEEVFHVYRDHHDFSLNFYADLYGRVITGEMLKISVDYRVSKDFIPQMVVIKRSLGGHCVTETYQYFKNKGIIHYSFLPHPIDGASPKVHEEDIPTSSIFSIAAPASCISFLFLRTKKEDTTKNNFYYIFRSYNKWHFEQSPVSTLVAVERQSSSHKIITLGNKKTIQAIPYKVYEGHQQGGQTPAIMAYLSKDIAIPYLTQDPEGTKIQIHHFNNFDRE